MTRLGEIEAAIEKLSSEEVVDLEAWLKTFVHRQGIAVDSECVEREWLAEADRRWNDIQSGSVSTIPAARVMEDAQRALEE